MKHAQTIAMAEGLLAQGRSGDVVRMIEPLIRPLPSVDALRTCDMSQVRLHCLLARIRMLQNGDAPGVLELLRPLEPMITRNGFDTDARAEVALWLGWAHAWQATASFDDAHAVNLFDRAERLFSETLNSFGRCWARIGQAQAFFTIDEYPLMQQALEEAAELQNTIRDVQARAWIHDLNINLAHFQGRYAAARHHTDMLASVGRDTADPMARGRALAYRATLDFDLGRDPGKIIEQAREATHIMIRSVVTAGYPLLAAYRCHIRALLRRGDLHDADELIDEAMDAAAGIPAAPGHILAQRARLDLIRGEFDSALGLLDGIFNKMHRLQQKLLASSLALLCCQIYERQGDLTRALEWADRAYGRSRETGHAGYQLQALLHRVRLQANRHDLDSARQTLQQCERYTGHFSLLPYAALRFSTLAHLALNDDNEEDARAYFAQALSAYSLIGDVYHAARMQLSLSRLGRREAPAQARPLLDAAILTFDRLQAPRELDESQELLALWPKDGAGKSESHTAGIGASLARAALSVDLVAEAWLQAAEALLPARWMALYRHAGMWHPVRVHGVLSSELAFPDPSIAETKAGNVCWIRLLDGPETRLFFGVATTSETDAALSVAIHQLQPWLPVVRLALEYAILRARQFKSNPSVLSPNGPEAEIPIRGFVSASSAMRHVVRQVQRIRASHSPVLITGESGTGKELIARAVHTTSERALAPFLVFNCSTIPRELFESHLFGHEKSAFTGAVSAHKGVIREADRGTLFLDEIGDLPLDVQPKLLRFLQEGEVFPLGAKRPVNVNVRVISATNQDLETLIREGRFREDLYYRLNVIPLRVPPLRERREEIPLLVQHFLQTLRPKGTPLASITQEAQHALLAYNWPGNVRQLRNEIERALVFLSNEPLPMIDFPDLSEAVMAAGTHNQSSAHRSMNPAVEVDLETHLAAAERQFIERTLTDTNGQITAAARMLGLTRQGLYKKMKRLGVDGSKFHRDPSASPGGSMLHMN